MCVFKETKITKFLNPSQVQTSSSGSDFKLGGWAFGFGQQSHGMHGIGWGLVKTFLNFINFPISTQFVAEVSFKSFELSPIRAQQKNTLQH